MIPPLRRALAALACLLLAAPVALAEPPDRPGAGEPVGEPPAAAPPLIPGQEVVVLLRDGQRLRGRLVSQDADGVTIESSGARLVLPAATVLGLAAPGSAAAEGPWPRDANRTRYLYSPSGFMLRQGELYLSQTELLITSIGVGVTDWLTLQAGTVLPVALFDVRSTPFIVAVKAGASPSRLVHLAGGFQTFMVPGLASGAYGVLFGTLTLGTEDLHLGVSAGPTFALGQGRGELGQAIVTASANWRVSRSIALVTENWFFPGSRDVTMFDITAVRFIRERLSVDVGFFLAKGVGAPLPWLDFTWHGASPGR